MVAGISHSQKAIFVLDLLVPATDSILHKAQTKGGNIVVALHNSCKILAFNAKPGHLTEFNVVKNELTVGKTSQLGREEITAATTSHDERSLVVGYSDGQVKVFDIDEKGELKLDQARETISAFTNIYGKK